MSSNRTQYIAILLILSIISLLTCSATTDLYAVTLRGSVDRTSQESILEIALAYKLVDPLLSISISSASADDTDQLSSGSMDFSTRLQGWSDAVAASSPNLEMLPLFLTGVVPVYRLDSLGLNAPPITFTRAAIVDIHTGVITSWNDPELVNANPLVSLPDQNITILMDAARGARPAIMKRAFYQFNSTMFAESGMRVDNSLDYPFHKFADYRLVSGGVTAMATSIISNDGAFGLAMHSVAKAVGLKIGQMVNKAGKVVSLTPDSLTFAALERGAAKPRTRTIAHVLTDAESEFAWPLPMFTYLVIDTQYSAQSCRVRQATVSFFLYILQGPRSTNGKSVDILL